MLDKGYAGIPAHVPVNHTQRTSQHHVAYHSFPSPHAYAFERTPGLSSAFITTTVGICVANDRHNTSVGRIPVDALTQGLSYAIVITWSSPTGATCTAVRWVSRRGTSSVSLRLPMYVSTRLLLCAWVWGAIPLSPSRLRLFVCVCGVCHAPMHSLALAAPSLAATNNW